MSTSHWVESDDHAYILNNILLNGTDSMIFLNNIDWSGFGHIGHFRYFGLGNQLLRYELGHIRIMPDANEQFSTLKRSIV